MFRHFTSCCLKVRPPKIFLIHSVANVRPSFWHFYGVMLRRLSGKLINHVFSLLKIYHGNHVARDIQVCSQHTRSFF